MFCLYCGNNLPGDAIFCNQCGKWQKAPNAPVPDNRIQFSPPLSGKIVSGGQLSMESVPLVPGTPQVSELPGVQGAPAMLHNPAGEQAVSHNVAPLSPPPSTPWQPPTTHVEQPISNLHRHNKPQTMAPLHPHTKRPDIEPESSPNHDRDIRHHRHDGKRYAKSNTLHTAGHLSRRAVLISLAGATTMAAAGGGIVWWRLSSSSSTDPHLLNTYQGDFWGSSVAWSPDSKRIAAGTTRETVRVWNVVDGGNTLIHKEKGLGGWAELAWSPDGKYIVSGHDGQVYVWDATSGADSYTFTMSHDNGFFSLINNVAWSPDSQYVVSTGDSIVQVWNARNGSSVFSYHGHKPTISEGQILVNDVNTVAWSPDGKRIASGAQDKTVQVWDAFDGGNVFTYRGHSAIVNTVAWSPDGTYIASGGWDNTVQVWDASNGRTLLTYRGHPNVVHAVAWSPDSKRIVSAGGDTSFSAKNTDNTLQVWDGVSGRTIYTYYGHPVAVVSVAWSPDGTRIASGSWNGTVQIWKAP